MAIELDNLYYSVTVDDTALKAQLEKLKQQLKEANNELVSMSNMDGNKLADAFKETGKSVEQVKAQLSSLNQIWNKVEFGDTKTQNEIIAKYKELDGVLSQYGDTLERTIAKQNAATKTNAFDLPENTLGNIQAKIKALSSEKLEADASGIAKYTQEINRLKEAYDKLNSVGEVAPQNRNLSEVLGMSANSLDEISVKLKELRRVRGEQNAADSEYIGNMTRIAQAEVELINKQRQALEVGKQKLSLDDQINRELSKTPLSIEGIKKTADEIEKLYRQLDNPDSQQGASLKNRWIELQQQASGYGITLRSTVMEQRTFEQSMNMSSNTISEIERKLKALEQVRRNENTQTKEGKKNIASINAEYNRLIGILKDAGVRSRGLNEILLSQQRVLGQLKNQLGSVFSIYALQNFIKKMTEIRGQFELQQVSLRSILQNKEAADRIFSQTVQLGLTSPFTTMQLISYTKQLAAYRIETKELYDTTRRLSDVSAGLGVDMQRLILAYGQVRAASVLRGQEVRQFTEAGIPLIDELAKKFSQLEGRAVSTGEVFEKVSKRMVSFEMVKEVFEDLTNVGGIFYKMQEIQSKTLYGQIQNLSDALDLMFNNIGKANDGVLKDGISLIYQMVENYDLIAEAIKVLVVSYGAYRSAILVTWAAERLLNQERATSFSLMTNLNKAIKANPYAFAATAIVGLIAAYRSYLSTLKSAERAEKRYRDGLEEVNKKVSERKQAFHDLIIVIKDETQLEEDRNRAFESLKRLFPDILSGYANYNELLKNTKTAIRELNSETNNLTKEEVRRAQLNAKQRYGELEYKKQQLESLTRSGVSSDAHAGLLMQIERIQSEMTGLDVEIAKWNEEWKRLNGEIEKSAKYESLGWVKQIKDFVGARDDFNFLNPQENGGSMEDVSSYIKRIRQEYKEASKDLEEYQSLTNKEGLDINGLKNKIRAYEQISTVLGFNIKDQKTLNKELREENKALKEWEKSQKKLVGSYKDELKLVEQVRKSYLDLRSDAEKFNDGTVDGLRIYNEMLGKIPENLNNIFKGEQYKDILSNSTYNDASFREYLNSLTEKAKEAGVDSGDAFAEELSRKLGDIDVEAGEAELKRWTDNYMKALELRNRLFNEEAPEGQGFTYRLSKIMTDTLNDITSKSKDISKAIIGATDEQKASLLELQDAWSAAYNEEGIQKAEKLAQSYFNEILKSQKLDIDMSGLSSATLSQLNMLRDALRGIEQEFTGKGLVDAFDAVGLSIEELKGFIDTTNLSTAKNSISDLLAFTPEDVELTENQKQALEAILRILGVIDKNVKKGLFDIKLEKLEKAKDIANEIASSFNDIGAALSDLGEATGDNSLSEIGHTISFLGDMTEGVSSLVTGIVMKDPREIIKGILDITTTLIKAEAEYQKAKLEFQKHRIEYQTKYNSLLVEQIRLQKEGADGILYENMLQEFRNTYKAMIEAQNQARNSISNAIVGDKARLGMVNGKLGYIPSTERPAENLEEFLSSITVKTGVKRKRVMGITVGKKDIYNDLLSQYPELIDSAGNLNLETAELILSTHEFQGAGKEAFEQLISAEGEYRENLEDLNDQIESLFGQIGGDISNALISSFQDGQLAAYDFFEVVNKGIGDMLDALVSNMITSAIFGDILDKYPDLIKGALLGKNPEEDITTVMGNLAGEVAGGYNAAADAMAAYDKAKREAGLGGVGDSDEDRQGLSSGIARASQESIDVLTGLAYSLQGMSAESRNIQQTYIPIISAELSAQTQILKSIQGLNVKIEQHAEKISINTESLSQIRSDISDLNTKGIEIKRL